MSPKRREEKARSHIKRFKLFGKSNSRNDRSIVVDRDLNKKIVEVMRKTDRVIISKIVLNTKILNIVSYLHA